jgi:hypothetical protein
VVGLDIKVADPQAALARAAVQGLRLRDGGAMICGTAIRPVT